uniref:RNA-directed RNA polymerase n=2 Tax=Panagrolaimus sp. PS1159 TaxID=55785 RepID=A0AC35GXF1_9BILA
MSTVHCRLIFRSFTGEQIAIFLKECENHEFVYLINFITGQSVHYGTGTDAFDERHEVQFSFNLKPLGELGFTKEQKYDGIVLAECELASNFKRILRSLEYQLAEDATVLYTPLSKDIYPKFFQLQSVFSVNRILFGNIVNKRVFAPTFGFDQPVDASSTSHNVFKKYLQEQRDMVDDVDTNMLMICEHDREELSICFPDILNDKMKLAEYRSNERVVEIKFKYLAIRRLIVTPRCDENGVRVTFTFQLNYSPSVYVHEKSSQPSGAKKLYFRPPSRYLTWNKGYDLERVTSYASCLVIETRDVNARSLLDCLDRFRKCITYGIEYRFLDRSPNINVKNYAKNFFMDKKDLPDKYLKYIEPEYFPLVYAVQAILSRKETMYDYLFRPTFNKFEEFLALVTERFENDLINEPDAITTVLDKKGYMRVRKVVVTPTRKLYANPELIMGNRSLRKKGADGMLRVVFRDDNGMNLSGLPHFFIETTVKGTLSYPMDVGFHQFSYLCSSNSQLRDHGCYFLAGTPDDVKKFREGCGQFKSEAIPKMMSRLAQCFTQAQQLGISIKREDYSDTFDYTGGADGNGKAYTFSDGCGILSKRYCEKIVQDLKLGDCLPSCYQIRFQGYKGVITMNSFMDEIREYAKRNNRKPVTEKGEALPWYEQSIIFRPSQMKFYAPREKHVEIVKISAPIAVSLNKPLINILDQVSEMHGVDSHKRMCDRIFELLENDVDRIVSALVDEPAAFITLNEFPKYIFYDRLRDFNITEEPFFRSLLRSSALVSLHQLVDKMQIRIPTSQGRMMFGVVDETGLLQYGQVFFQYTTNASVKYPGPYADKVVHTGLVMITKNPSVVAGDVRMFEAVDLPCLHDLVDVIVFPQSGPRPHPDEMAGSDLDGDEYSIFWDPLLLLDRNEPAFDFTAPPAPKPPHRDDVLNKLTESMISFFTSYVSQDSIGAIANSHVANSDLYGINSEHCHNIAIKHNQAVDFPKSGQVPAPLKKGWEEGLPPEKVERYPNFMAKSSQASYKSIRLLGDLYNRVIEIREIIRIEDLISADEIISVDESVMYEGWKEYIDNADAVYTEYCILIGGLMETYGIANEGQLFSGRFTALKKRLTDKENDNFDMYNSEHMIQEQLAEIYSRFREQFFEAFGGIEEHTDFDEFKFNGTRETFRRVCNNPRSELRMKASAYYYVAYSNRKHLSFGWLVADILEYNRKQYCLQPDNRRLSLYPLNDRLSEYINDTCASPEFKSRFDEFNRNVEMVIEKGSSIDFISYHSGVLCNYFIGLRKLLFFFRLWAEKHNIKADPKRLDGLFIRFGLGEFQAGSGGWLTVVAMSVNQPVVDVEVQLGGIGKKFWDLIRFIMTRQFGNMKKVTLEPITKRTLDETHCRPLYYAAIDTFYSIAVNRRFENLPGGNANDKLIEKVAEGSIFIIELPRIAVEDYQDLCSRVAKRCGLSYVVLRKKPDRVNQKSFRVAVKPVGTFIAVRKFRSLLEVSPCMSIVDLEKRSNRIAVETYKRIQFYSDLKRSLEDDFIFIK